MVSPFSSPFGSGSTASLGGGFSVSALVSDAVVDVNAFRPTGNGTTDDSTAFAAAVGAAATRSGVLVLQPGATYLLTMQQAWSTPFSIEGNGATIILHPPDNTPQAALLVTDFTGCRWRNLTIRRTGTHDVGGSGYNTATTLTIAGDDTDDTFVLENVRTEFAAAIGATTGVTAATAIIDDAAPLLLNCDALNLLNAPGDGYAALGLLINGPYDGHAAPRIMGGRFAGGTGDQPVGLYVDQTRVSDVPAIIVGAVCRGGTGVHANGVAGDDTAYAEFYNCDIEGGTGAPAKGYEGQAGSRMSFHGCRIAGGTGTGSQGVQAGSGTTRLVGCTIEGGSGSACEPLSHGVNYSAAYGTVDVQSCLLTPKRHSYFFRYKQLPNSTATSFQPYTGSGWRIVMFELLIPFDPPRVVASGSETPFAVGTTVDIGTTLGGHELIQAAPLDQATPVYTPAAAMASAYTSSQTIYVTPSVTAAVDSIWVRLVVEENVTNTFGISDFGTVRSHLRVTDSTIISCPASGGTVAMFGSSMTAGTSFYDRCTIINRSGVAVYVDSTLTYSPFRDCTFEGTVPAGVPLRLSGFGVPAVAAPIGSTYARLDGGANTSIYVKESGTSTSGWVAK